MGHQEVKGKREEAGNSSVLSNDDMSQQLLRGDLRNNRQTEVIVYAIFFSTAAIAVTIYLTRR